MPSTAALSQIAKEISSEMFKLRKIEFWWKAFLLIFVFQILYIQYGETVQSEVHSQKYLLLKKILKIVTELERFEEQQASTQLGALIVEFLIKQKERFFEPTRNEAQIYSKILHKCSSIINARSTTTPRQKRILEKVFQRHVQLIPPVLRGDQIDTELEFESLKNDYELLVRESEADAAKSDLCFEAIVSLGENECKMPKGCLEFLISAHPNYGYSRTHQVLLLYVFMHHKCAQKYGSRQQFEKIVDHKCTQIYREVNVIQSRNITQKYRDLYLEQNTVCSLFGYNEFLNWENVDSMPSRIYDNDCRCYRPRSDLQLCYCDAHISTMLLTYYVNAWLLLN